MGITKAMQVLSNEENLRNLINSIDAMDCECPYIMEESLKLLNDDNIGVLSDSEIKSLCIMLSLYFKNCYCEFIEDLHLDKILQFGKIEVYKILAYDGLRFATENEVKHGVKGLIPEYIFPAGEENFKMACLLQWTFCGRSFFIRNAGYTLKYNKDGKVENSFWELLSMCAQQLMEMFAWVSDRKHIEKTIKLLQKMKKAGGYKYAQFEKDEVTEDITVKQLVYNIVNTFPKNSNNIDYRRTLALAIGKKSDNRVLTPYEISQMREIYDRYALDRDKDARRISKDGLENNKLKTDCEFIVSNRYLGVIDSGHFVYKIINTFDKYGYNKCSPKQYAIIEDALNILRNNNNSEEVTQVISDDIIDDSLESLSDAIGSGLFED